MEYREVNISIQNRSDKKKRFAKLYISPRSNKYTELATKRASLPGSISSEFKKKIQRIFYIKT